MVGIRFHVRGRVQGVGYRAYVQRQAMELGVVGSVWNRSDGGVEAQAFHPSESVLGALEFRLRQGPGRIDAVEVQPLIVPENHFGGKFEIGLTR